MIYDKVVKRIVIFDNKISGSQEDAESDAQILCTPQLKTETSRR